MVKVHLRKITRDNLKECLNLQVDNSQKSLVATNAQSLAEAYVDTNLFPFAVYDASVCGYEQPQAPMLGFIMYEIDVGGVGFIMRLMIDYKYQRQGYGRATMIEIIRRLKLHPDVEIIATSYRKENEVAASLYQSLGFTPWDIEWAQSHPTEIYVKLES
ncbi:spermidine acetyltransferase [Dulcicalothrix desertica PCC 7102]|uniref:Spermidine acetyltransferase n=1 Tax=Dulcicalothrix desertica PCC 7102 TaxID=232991 RepID=A0A433VIR4_9CYAN|nr:GNAT family N-acetyltransferase [Dulcicalothrix desertica]RUT05936.1 spermidine acetyltransferase [Dulcicalothrix desertica PCC 7102]TWH54432.1 diamine N-acetyltransferase [Dulcicalothrix desertica PCC 7102]